MKRLLLLCALLFFACAAYAQQPLNVWVKLPSVIPTNGIVYGTTNLPDGTILNLYLSTATPNENFDWQCVVDNGAKAVVFHGSFRRTLTGGKECLRPGMRYIFQVVMQAAFLQPTSVIAVIGKDGTNLAGPLVSGTGIGRGVQAKVPVAVR